MSTSGTYSYWPKVNNPNTQFVQMTSGEYQPPFFFGGSQIPMALNGSSGSGLQHTQLPGNLRFPQSGKPKYTVKPIYNDTQGIKGGSFRSTKGSGLEHATLAVSEHNDKIYIPKHLASMHM